MFPLVKNQLSWSISKLDAQEILLSAKILNNKMLIQVILDLSNASNVSPNDDDIINIYSQYDASNKSRVSKEDRVHFTRSQSLRENKLIEFCKPCT